MATSPTDISTVVRVAGLTRRYGRTLAISNVSFSIHEGEILGLIGPNGAGKTTLLECLAGVQPADSGTVTFLNNAARTAQLFYVPDGIAPWPEQSVRWALDFTLGYFGGRRTLYDEVIRDLRIEPLLNVRIGALSKGQRKRAMLAIGLLAPQPVLVIDEPFEGLDLRQSREVYEVIRKHVAAGRTVFVSIHQIADAGKFCDRFVLLTSGVVVAEGTLAELKSQARTLTDDFEEIFLALT